MNVVDMPKRQSAFCVACKIEVMVLLDLACPRCGDQVDPLSLPRVPGSEDRPTVLVATVPERQAVQRETARPAEIARPPATEQAKVALPSIDNVVQWYADTKRLYARLEADEARLVADLRGVRQMRKLLGTTLGLIEEPERQNVSPSNDVPVCEPETILPEAETMAPPPVVTAESPEPVRSTGRLALGPAHPDYAPRPVTSGDGKRWALEYAACVDCGKSDRPHMAKGRCRGCYGPWIKAGRPQ